MSRIKVDVALLMLLCVVGYVSVLQGMDHTPGRMVGEAVDARLAPFTIEQLPQERRQASLALLDAIKKRDVLAIHKALAENASVEVIDQEGRSPLMWAVFHDEGNSADIASVLLDNKADVDGVDGGGHTPLWLAACFGRAEAAKVLFEHRADINKTYADVSLLSIASSQGHLPVLQVLLDYNVDPNVADAMNFTPLEYFINSRTVDIHIAEVLLKGKADVNRVGYGNFTPLKRALVCGSEPMTRMMIAYKADVNKVATTASITPLMQVLQSGGVMGVSGLANLLLECNADIEAIDGNGKTVLMRMAAAKGFKSGAVRFLLENKTNVNAQTGAGVTALMLSGNRSRGTVSDMLIDYGADPHLEDSMKNTVLTTAHETMRERILERYAAKQQADLEDRIKTDLDGQLWKVDALMACKGFTDYVKVKELRALVCAYFCLDNKKYEGLCIDSNTLRAQIERQIEYNKEDALPVGPRIRSKAFRHGHALAASMSRHAESLSRLFGRGKKEARMSVDAHTQAVVRYDFAQEDDVGYARVSSEYSQEGKYDDIVDLLNQDGVVAHGVARDKI